METYLQLGLEDTVATALSDTAGFWAEQVSNSLSHTAWFFLRDDAGKGSLEI